MALHGRSPRALILNTSNETLLFLPNYGWRLSSLKWRELRRRGTLEYSISLDRTPFIKILYARSATIRARWLCNEIKGRQIQSFRAVYSKIKSGSTGLEPATSTVTGWCSNQLNYNPSLNYYFMKWKENQLSFKYSVGRSRARGLLYGRAYGIEYAGSATSKALLYTRVKAGSLKFGSVWNRMESMTRA